MKKILLFKNNSGYKLLKNVCLIIIFTVSVNLVLASSIFNMQTRAYNLKDVTIKEAIKYVLKESKYNLIYSVPDVQSNSKISLFLENATTEEALKNIMENTGLSYSVKDNNIIISKQQTPQSIKITGKVIDAETKKPIAGATVMVKNTTIGAISAENGEFSVTVKEASAELEITFIGMLAVTKKVTKDEDNLIIAMTKDVLAIEDVVVNGVFERKAGTFTGSVTTLKAEDLKRVGNSNALQALKNLDPSIMFYDNMDFGSDPNKLPEMSIRGKSSLNIEDNDLRTFQNDPNAPLFVLDGFEVSMQKIMDLDMDRIETMSILKDASAKAIYGSKAANGVIVIELKKNASGKLRVTYNGSIEVQAPDLTSYNLTNAREKLDIEKASGQFDDNDQSFNTIRTLNQLYNQRLSFVTSGIDTDWISKPLRSGVGTKHGVSVDLGSEDLKAIIDLSYQNVQGTMKGSDRTNIAGAATISYRHKKFLFKDQLTITSNTSNDSPYGSFSEYTQINPYYSPYDANGQLSRNIVPELSNRPNDAAVASWYGKMNFEQNPLYNASLNTLLQQKYIDITNNFELQYYATEELKLTLRFGLSEQRNKLDNFYPSNHLKFNSYTEAESFRKGSYQLNNGQESNLSGKFDIQYNKEIFPKNMIYANAGYELSQRKSLLNETSAEGFPSDKMNDIMFALQYTKDTKPTGREQTVRELGYYLSLNYSYDNRINVDGTFRQSASSMYGADSRWGAFWSTGVSWNLNNEKWLRGSAITKLRVRATIGSTGSQSSSAYNGIASYRYFLDQTYEGLLAAELISMKNEELKWQEKMDKNIGFDFAVKNSLSLSFDYYHSVTNNAVNPLSLSPSTGFTSVQENVGKIKNVGFDIKVRYTIWQKPADRSSLSVSVGLLNNKNTLLEISDAMKNYNTSQNNKYEEPKLGGEDKRPTKPVIKFYDGVSMDAIWAMQSLGIDPANGNEIYIAKDENGNYYRTYDYDPGSQVICGNALPKISGNASVNFDYKGFGFNCVFMFKYGGQMYNTTLVDKVENASLTFNVDRRIYSDRWRNPGDIAPYKRINTKEVSAAKRGSSMSDKTFATSRFVQDRNELSISSLQLSYDFFRHKFVKKIGMERMRIAFNANDLVMLSSIEIERGTSYPFARNFNASLSFTF